MFSAICRKPGEGGLLCPSSRWVEIRASSLQEIHPDVPEMHVRVFHVRSCLDVSLPNPSLQPFNPLTLNP